jgi:hypothetical protein
MKQNNSRCKLQHQIWHRGSVVLSATEAAALVRLLKSSRSFGMLMNHFKELRNS